MQQQIIDRRLSFPRKVTDVPVFGTFESKTARGTFCMLQETILDQQGTGSLSFDSLPTLRNQCFIKPTDQT